MAKQPQFTVRDIDGEPIAGDDRLDSSLKYIAAEADGYITNRAQEVVYDARPVALPEESPDEEEDDSAEDRVRS
ncbi:hypothetical protein SEA_EDEN_66 [Microbacterium phage Eden]|uniref:Uncharacterized protein n=1 Tax=Microbacterium phage Eden TaxID=2250289 RepID=A0A345KWF9_9CAUD|nr:hypothetical protein HOT71_gp66 [Microbacterium phage Eden]AXH47361.1 hypothetical protein SEA_EDEN_66 [Microbacterium phage Eden]